ncbi:Ig-like domain-containing protein, partial [Pseudophaeobacter sp.]|uniref:beta strand repeat-containing protein n=1 Tax=Pseudophaeobacter sp. TaxID=1971739 RepID=UPI003298EF39
MGGGYWKLNEDTIVSGPSIQVNALETCGYTNPVIISQTGPSGATYAADGYIGMIWRASEGASSEVYEYEFAISGASSTYFIDTRTLIGTRPTAAISANTASLRAGQTAVITFTTSTSVTLANASAITASNGTLGAISGGGTTFSATFTPNTGYTGSAQITIGNGAFEAAIGLNNQDAADSNNTVSIAVDTTPPTVSIAPFTGPLNGAQTAAITLSEASTDFTLADLTLTNATATLSGSGTSYTAVLTPVADGAVALSVAAGSFSDAAGNLNAAASNEVTTTYDATAPTVSIAAFTGPLNGAQTAAITLSEASTDFTLADLTLTNATATLSGSAASYTAVLTPIADGPVALSVAAGTFSDAAGNVNAAASNEVTTTYDATAPTVSIAAFTGPLNGAQSAQITLSEASTDFTAADLTLTNATATLSGSGTSYTAVLTPIADGPVALSVAAGTFRDAAGNVNASASNEVTASHDGTAPTVSIAAFTGSMNGAQSAEITLSEASTDFDTSDLTLTNATATLSGSGTSYTAVLTPIADGPVALSVAAGTFSDAAGNVNAAASNEVSTSHDGTAPTISIAAFSGPLNGAQSAEITLSEASTDFDTSDLTLTNATATLSGSGTSYTAVLTPLADGLVALSVAPGTFSDAAGNVNTLASNEVTTAYDGTAPIISISAFTGPLNGNQSAAITLSEASTDFDLSDLTLTNATATLSGSGTSYTAVLTPVADGPVALSV